MSLLLIFFQNKKTFILNGLILIIIILALIIPGKEASAHPADMYAQEEAITINPGGLSLDWKITPGPLLAGAIWDEADRNHDGTIGPDEALVWFKPIAPQWQLTLNGRPLTEIQLVKIHFPAKMDILVAGDEPIDIQFLASWPTSTHGNPKMVIHDAFQEPISLNWFSLKSQSGVTFTEPSQISGQLETSLFFSGSSPNPGDEKFALTSWVSGTPSLPGLTGAITSAAASIASSSQGVDTVSTQANPISSLLSRIRTQNATPTFLLGACLLSLALGCLHALTPGHGKALVAAYLVGSQGRTRDAVFLGSVVTITHTGSVLLLGLVTLIASRYILPSLVIPWLDVLSGIFVIAFGINLLIRRGRSLVLWRQSNQEKSSAKKIIQIKPMSAEISNIKPLTHSHPGGLIQTHEPGDSEHAHSHPHAEQPHDHEHVHSIPGNQVTWKSLLSLGISGGLVPCPDAIAILLVAVAVNRIPLGMLLIVAFSLGLALVLIGIGIAMVHGFRFITRSELVNRLSPYTPVASAVAVLVLGIGLTWTALNGGFTQPTIQPESIIIGSSPALTGISSATVSGLLTGFNRLTGRSQLGMAVQPASIAQQPNFDLGKARLMYIAADSQNEDQLYVMRLSGGSAIPYTNDPAGILEYSLSQDKKNLLYSVLDPGGDSAIWGMATDGTQKHVILRCPQAECDGAVWSPDGQSLVYERHDYNSTSTLPLPALWWLNLKTGETKPIFRDASFPSYSPRFSVDGQWLSYITPTNNTLQIFNLHTGQNQSVPYRSGMTPLWSPTDTSLLYWDQIVVSDHIIYHLKRYIVSSGETVNLSGSPNQEDYTAAWSPDGQRIAIIRSNVNMNNSSDQEQVWLVRPDGSKAHPILTQDGVSYEDLSWTPDSHILAYQLFSSQDNQRVGEIWTVDVQNGKQTRIMSGGSQPTFLP